MVYIRQVGLRDSAGVWRAEQFDGVVLVKREQGAVPAMPGSGR
jgi:hypothetical protein